MTASDDRTFYSIFPLAMDFGFWFSDSTILAKVQKNSQSSCYLLINLVHHILACMLLLAHLNLHRAKSMQKITFIIKEELNSGKIIGFVLFQQPAVFFLYCVSAIHAHGLSREHKSKMYIAHVCCGSHLKALCVAIQGLNVKFMTC